MIVKVSAAGSWFQYEGNYNNCGYFDENLLYLGFYNDYVEKENQLKYFQDELLPKGLVRLKQYLDEILERDKKGETKMDTILTAN